MGDPKRPKKKWRSPKHPWRKDQLMEELNLIGEYGLRNKRELWRLKMLLDRYRAQAKLLLSLPAEQRKLKEPVLLGSLVKLGIINEKATIDDVLGLNVRSLLERRLQTIVYRKGLARSIHEARQLITHGHIVVNGYRVRTPSYLVPVDEEETIKTSLPLPKPNSR